jgi:hypothetical protein
MDSKINACFYFKNWHLDNCEFHQILVREIEYVSNAAGFILVLSDVCLCSLLAGEKPFCILLRILKLILMELRCCVFFATRKKTKMWYSLEKVL